MDGILKDYIKIKSAFKMNGDYFSEETKGIKHEVLSDIITSKKYAPLLTKVSEEVIVQSIKPAAVITSNLFKPIQVAANEKTVRLTVIGQLYAEPKAEGSLAKQVEPDISNLGNKIRIDIEKYALSLAMTQEAIENDNWGLLKYFLAEAGNALLRTMEKQAYNLIDQTGTVVFDNFNPDSSVYKITTGRGIDGKLNGGLSYNDFMKMYAFLLMRGYKPDTLILSPFAWNMMTQDPAWREVMINAGQIITETVPNGEPFPGFGEFFNGLGVNTTAVDNPFTTELKEYGATFRGKLAFNLPLKIIITDRVRFEQKDITIDGINYGENGVTDVILADSSAAGLFVHKGGPKIRAWEDYPREANFWEVSMSWGMGIARQGQGIAIARNVITTRTYSFDNVNSVKLDPINPADHTISGS